MADSGAGEVSKPRRYRRRPSNAAIIEALTESGGVMATAARRLGCHRQRLHEWLGADPALQAAREAALNDLLDQAEQHVFDAVKGGDLKASMFVLRSLGAQRGYRSGLEMSTTVNVATFMTVPGDESL